MKNIKLRYQIVIWTAALEVVLLLVFAGVFVTVLQKSQNQQIEETLHLSAAQLNAVVDIQAESYRVSTVETADMRSRGVMAWILDRGGQPALTIGNAENYALPAGLPRSGQSAEINLTNEEPVRVLVTPLTEGANDLGTLVVAIPLRSSQNVLRQIYLGLAIAIPLVVVLSAAGGLFLARRALQPVAAITQTARQISAADLSQRIALELPDDEIGQLAQTFDAMLERLDNAFRRERQFTSDVSHELRTPLSLMKTQLSLARSRPRDATTLLEMMDGMECDVDRMTRLVEQMLALTRVEQRGLDPFSLVDLGTILRDVTDQFQDKAIQEGIALRLVTPQKVDLNLMGDEERLRQVFTNIIENAFKYTPRGGQVNLEALHRGEQIEVVIADSGEAIPAEHIPHIFERFYRVESSRSRDSGGAGIGLAISQEIIHRHGGVIEVQSEPGSGTVFTIRLPVEQS